MLDWNGIAVNTCTIAKLMNSNWIGDCLSHFSVAICRSSFAVAFVCLMIKVNHTIWIECIKIAFVRAACCRYLLAKSYQASSVSKIWLIRYDTCLSAMSAKVPFVWIREKTNQQRQHQQHQVVIIWYTTKLVTLQSFLLFHLTTELYARLLCSLRFSAMNFVSQTWNT